MSDSLDSKHSVSIARGKRDYIHAIDLLRAAPLSTSDQSFRFRFSHIIKYGGTWRLITSETDRPIIKAELAIQRGNSLEKWGFVCDEQADLIAAPDFQANTPIGLLSRSIGTVTVDLWSGADFWEQLVEAVRFGGDLLFPNGNWLTVGISGSGACLLPLQNSATLTLELLNARSQLNVIRFVTSDGRDGHILTTPRPDHAR